MRQVKWIVVSAFICVLVLGIVLAQDSDRPKDGPKGPAGPKGPEGAPPEISKELLEYLQKNHPEVLDEFKKNRGQQKEFGPRGQMPGRDERPGDDEAMRQPMTEDERKELTQFLKEYRPEVLEQLQNLRKENPEKANNLIMRHYADYKRLKSDPAMFEEFTKAVKSEKQTMELANKYRQTTDAAQKEQVKTQLKTALNELFDLREKPREREIARLEKELSQMKDTFNKRKQSKDQIVEKRLKEMTGEAQEEEMKW